MKYLKEDVREYLKDVRKRYQAQVVEGRNHGQAEFEAVRRLLAEDIPKLVEIVAELVEPPKCTCAKCSGFDLEACYKDDDGGEDE